MVYLGNIISSQMQMDENDAICLLTTNNKKIIIGKYDKLSKINGDLKISKNSCYCFVDCNEVVTAIIGREDIIRGEYK